MQFVDAHCHLNAPCFADNIETVINRAREAGVVGAVIVSETIDDFEHTLSLAERYKGFVYPCLGIHPIQKGQSVQLQQCEQALLMMSQHVDKIIGVGEVRVGIVTSLLTQA